MNTGKLKFFIAYCAVRQDQNLRLDLEKHISPIIKSEDIFWFDNSSDYTQEKIYAKLNEANVIGLLISPEFTHLYQDNNSLFHNVVNLAIKRLEQKEIYLIPIVIRRINAWQEALNLQDIKYLPEEDKAVIDRSWTKDEAFFSVAQSLQHLVNEIHDYLQRVRQFQIEAFQLIQQVYPSCDEALERLKEIQDKLDIQDKDASSTQAKILEFKKESWQSYAQFFQKLVQYQHSVTDASRSKLQEFQKELHLTDREAKIIERPILEHAQASVKQPEYRENRTEFSSLTQDNASDSMLMVALIIGVMGVATIATIVAGVQGKLPLASSTSDSNCSEHNRQYSQIEGWIWVGTTNNPSSNVPEGSPLDIDSMIEPAHIPSQGEILTVTQKVRLWNDMSEEIGEVEAGSRFIAVKTKTSIDSNNSSPVTKVWAAIRKCE